MTGAPYHAFRLVHVCDECYLTCEPWPTKPGFIRSEYPVAPEASCLFCGRTIAADETLSEAEQVENDVLQVRSCADHLRRMFPDDVYRSYFAYLEERRSAL